MTMIRVVIVSYFGAADAVKAVRSLNLNPADEPDTDVVVVDNSGDEDEIAILDRLTLAVPWVRVERAPSNLGYLGGARYALDAVSTPSAAWTVVANPDLTFSPDFLSRLQVATPDRVLAPTIVSEVTGRDQNPYLRHRPGRWARLRWRAVYAVPILARLYQGFAHLYRRRLRTVSPLIAPVDGAAIYAPHGSCLVLPHAYFDAGGDLQHSTLLFGEEITLAEKCRSLGIPVFHDPNFQVWHREHGVTGVWRSTGLLRLQRDSVRDVVRLLSHGDVAQGVGASLPRRRLRVWRNQTRDS